MSWLYLYAVAAGVSLGIWVFEKNRKGLWSLHGYERYTSILGVYLAYLVNLPDVALALIIALFLDYYTEWEYKQGRRNYHIDLKRFRERRRQGEVE